jgi:MATE family multidrug resistance protein
MRAELRPTLRLALPLVLAEIGWMSMGIVDTLMVGRLPKAAVAIGAVSLGTGLYYTVSIFAGGLLFGLDTLASNAVGRGDLEDANKSLANAYVIVGVLAPVAMLVVWLWTPIMAVFGIDPGVLRELGPFLNALNWGTLPLLTYFALRRYLQAVHVVKPITFALVTANAVNAVCNWIFIYGHWGVKAYGVPGSGWSTCIARLYFALVLLAAALWFNRKKRLSMWRLRERLDPTRIRRLLAIGGPAAAQMLLEIGIFATAAAMIGRIGALPLAGHQIAINTAAFTYMVPLGISSAAAVRVGNALGRGDQRGARLAGWTAISLGAAFMTCAAIVLVSIPKLIARLYTPDPNVIAAGAALLVVAAAFQLFDGLQAVATGALRGAGETRIPMLVNLFAYWFVSLPVAWVLGFRFHWGAVGVWIGLCIGLMLIGTILLLEWKRTSNAFVHRADLLAAIADD